MHFNTTLQSIFQTNYGETPPVWGSVLRWVETLVHMEMSKIELDVGVLR